MEIVIEIPHDFKESAIESKHRGSNVGALCYHDVDLWAQRLIEGDRPHTVLDCCASAYAPFLVYMGSCDLPTIFLDNGVRVWLHFIVCGGLGRDALIGETIRLGATWCGHRGPAEAVLWENDHPKPVTPDPGRDGAPGTGVRHLDSWGSLRPVVKNRVVALRARPRTFVSDIDEYVTRRGGTFGHSISDASIPVVSRSRPRMVWNEYRNQFKALLPE